MKADPNGTVEASTHSAHMTRLLDGLATDQQLNMNYLIATWDDRINATAKDVIKFDLKLIKDLGTGDALLAAAAGIGKEQGKKQSGDKCP